MTTVRRLAVASVLGTLMSTCLDEATSAGLEPELGGTPDGDAPNDPQSWSWVLPTAVEPPAVPPQNPMSNAKVDLGRRLFYEPRLSGNETHTCATCHVQELAFTDGQPVSTGSTGGETTRGAPSLINTAYAQYYTWSNLVLRSFENHALVPLFGEEPIEMGASYFQEEILERLASDPEYPALFALAFPERDTDERITWTTIIYALASFQRSMISFEAPYDRFLNGEPDALSPAAERGRRLFFSERLACGSCHVGRLLSLAFPTMSADVPPTYRSQFRNTGLYNLDGHYPPQNPGIVEFTGDPADDGKHRIPSLRNIGITAPYMHDGSVLSLNAVLDHYAAGGRTITGDLAGVGAENPNKDPSIAGFALTIQERTDLIVFLYSLTDLEVLENPRFASSFAGEP